MFGGTIRVRTLAGRPDSRESSTTAHQHRAERHRAERRWDSAVEGTPGRGMADQHTNPSVIALRRLEASLQSHFREQLAGDLADDRDVQDCLAPFRLAAVPWSHQLLDWPARLFPWRPMLRPMSLT